MNRSWTPIIAGVLDIVQAIIYGAGPLVTLVMLKLQPFSPSMSNAVGHAFLFIAPFVIVGIPVGVLAMMGGIYSIKRRNWGLALIASIAVLFPSGICLGIFDTQVRDAIYYSDYTLADYWLLLPLIFAILTIILTVIARKQFATKPTAK